LHIPVVIWEVKEEPLSLFEDIGSQNLGIVSFSNVLSMSSLLPYTLEKALSILKKYSHILVSIYVLVIWVPEYNLTANLHLTGT
jgi:hypothetical protein